MEAPPKAFISYSHDSEEHKRWVHDFATTLRGSGVNVTLDQWHTVHGDQMPEFMERAIRENKFVLVICTPNYKGRSDNRQGGAGYEGDIMTGEVATTRNHRKFIPVLRAGAWHSSMPSWLAGKYGVDLTANPYSPEHYNDLLMTIHGQRPAAPPIGPNSFVTGASKPGPKTSAVGAALPATLPPSENEPVRIQNIIVDEVTEPPMDGAPGCALYAIPFRLSRQPTSEWAEIFEHTWKHPTEHTQMHRPRIASVAGDRIILDGTTLEEFQKYHRSTLKLVMKETNRLYDEWDRQRKAKAEEEKKRSEERRRNLRDQAGQLGDFDDFDE
jgi:hypothetical protein